MIIINIIGTIFWIIVIYKAGTALGKAIGTEINVANEKAYNRKKNAIGRKYTDKGIYMPHIADIMKKDKETVAKYKAEINELNRQFGKPEWK